jgi:nucleotide-binding universal stress UspA family protein
MLVHVLVGGVVVACGLRSRTQPSVQTAAGVECVECGGQAQFRARMTVRVRSTAPQTDQTRREVHVHEGHVGNGRLRRRGPCAAIRKGTRRGERSRDDCRSLRGHTVTAKFAEAAARVHANEDELRAKIERQAAELVRDGISATVEIAKTPAGRVARAIADSAADTGTDVIVVGTRGHGPLEGMLLGSVTQRLLHIAPCPVLVVPADRTRN